MLVTAYLHLLIVICIGNLVTCYKRFSNRVSISTNFFPHYHVNCNFRKSYLQEKKLKTLTMLASEFNSNNMTKIVMKETNGNEEMNISITDSNAKASNNRNSRRFNSPISSTWKKILLIVFKFMEKLKLIVPTSVTKWILSAIYQCKRQIYLILSPSNKKIVRFLSLGLFCLYSVQRYSKYASSLTTELSFAAFMQMLGENPERVKNLKVTSTSFFFLLDGKSRALTRVVPIEASILDKLLASGVDFTAPVSPKNIVGIAWTICYAFFLWKLSSRMMSGMIIIICMSRNIQ